MEGFKCPLDICEEHLIDIQDIGPAIIFTCKAMHEVTWEKIPVYSYRVTINKSYVVEAEDEETAKMLTLRRLQKELIEEKDKFEVVDLDVD